MKKFGVFLICLVLCFSLLSVGTFASDGQSIQCKYGTGDVAFSGAVLNVYYLGTVSDKKIVPNAPLSSYSVSFDISDTEKTTALASTLSAYITRDKIEPLITDTVDINGIADFNDQKFSKGAYLLTAEKFTLDGYVYFAEPVILLLPYSEGELVTLNLKYTKAPENEILSYKVLKSWTEDSKNTRPEKIEIQLLCDGKVYDTVSLSAENNWRYQWDNLSAAHSWIAVEKEIPRGYYVSIISSGTAFVITNTYSDYGNNPPTTATPDIPDNSDEHTDTTEKEEELPVTGALRWPIPYLAMAGILLFIVGYVKFRKSEENE